ncbi:flagellar hook-length control protein FliK [Zavarzinia sp.]|uniref:flagellar hook-length control protein FliK n=1 Tax=Zavarzinia sp. TaxID=2027920 RepID=UPI00356ACFEC
MDATAIIIPPTPPAFPAKVPAAADTAAGNDNFAAHLDQAQAQADGEPTPAKPAPPDETSAPQAKSDAKAGETPSATTGAVQVTEDGATAQASGKSANPGDQLGGGASDEAKEKAATDAAADPTAVLADMLTALTAPSQPQRQVVPTTTSGAVSAPTAEVKPDPGTALAKAGHDNGGKAAAGAREDAAKETERLADQAAAAPADRPAPQPAPTPASDAGSLAAAAASGTGTTPQAPAQAPAQAATTAAPSPRAAPVPVAPEALGLAIARHVADGQKVFEISLAPEELGRVDVRLEFAEDGRVTAHVYADRAETLGLLQRDRAELARSLAGQGLNADTTSLNFALRDGSGSSSGGAGNDGGNSGSGGRRGRGRDTGSGDGLGRIEATARQSRAAGSRALDIEV